MAEPLIVCRNLSYRYPITEQPVLRDLSFRIEPGEFVLLAGASGSGKSLLAQALLGILPRNARVSGSLFYQGRALTPAHRAQLADAGFEVGTVELDAIEAGGGSLRCCVGEIF